MHTANSSGAHAVLLKCKDGLIQLACSVARKLRSTVAKCCVYDRARLKGRFMCAHVRSGAQGWIGCEVDSGRVVFGSKWRRAGAFYSFRQGRIIACTLSELCNFRHACSRQKRLTSSYSYLQLATTIKAKYARNLAVKFSLAI